MEQNNQLNEMKEMLVKRYQVKLAHYSHTWLDLISIDWRHKRIEFYTGTVCDCHFSAVLEIREVEEPKKYLHFCS